LSSANCKTLD